MTLMGIGLYTYVTDPANIEILEYH